MPQRDKLPQCGNSKNKYALMPAARLGS